MKITPEMLERIYRRFNCRKPAYPDPVDLLGRYGEVRDREVAGLVASSLAFGRVAQILQSAARVLDPMGGSPADFLAGATRSGLRRLWNSFRHRWVSGEDVTELLWAIRAMMARHGSLQAGFMQGFCDTHANILPALEHWVGEFRAQGVSLSNRLLSAPSAGGACKRLNLYLRWMVRRDKIDPGGWTGIPPSKLLIPLDVHMLRIARRMGMTRRKQAGLRTAIEVTEAFRLLCPEDPVRYDYALTRLGMIGADLKLCLSYKKDVNWPVRNS